MGAAIKTKNYPISRSWNNEQSDILNLRFMHIYYSYEHFRSHIQFLRWHPYACFKFNPIFVQHKIAKIKTKQSGTSDFKTLDCPITKIFKICYPILICLYPNSLLSYRNIFVLQTELWILPFKWNLSQPSSLFVAQEFIETRLRS